MSFRCFFAGLCALIWVLAPVVWVSAAEEEGADAGSLQEEIARHIEEAQERMVRIDRRMQELDEERDRLHEEARTAHAERFEIRERVTQEDEEIQAMRARLEQLQQEVHALQEQMASRMAEHPDYVAQQERQEDVVTGLRAINREVSELSSERVRVQLELQGLERDLRELTDDPDARTIPDDADPHYSLEPPEQP